MYPFMLIDVHVCVVFDVQCLRYDSHFDDAFFTTLTMGMIDFNLKLSQQAHDIYTTSPQCRCNATS